jgi:hypothetical protein
VWQGGGVGGQEHGFEVRLLRVQVLVSLLVVCHLVQIAPGRLSFFVCRMGAMITSGTEDEERIVFSCWS